MSDELKYTEAQLNAALLSAREEAQRLLKAAESKSGDLLEEIKTLKAKGEAVKGLSEDVLRFARDNTPLIESIKDLDPTTVRSGLTLAKRIKGGDDPDSFNVDRLIKAEAALKAQQDTAEQTVQSLTAERDDWQAKYNAAKSSAQKTQISNELQAELAKAGATDMIGDAVVVASLDARFNEEAGRVEYTGPDGEVIMSGNPERMSKPVNTAEYVAIMKAKKPGFFGVTTGTGNLGKGHGSSDQTNPWSQDTWDGQRQDQLLRTLTQSEIEQLQRSAGFLA